MLLDLSYIFELTSPLLPPITTPLNIQQHSKYKPLSSIQSSRVAPSNTSDSLQYSSRHFILKLTELTSSQTLTAFARPTQSQPQLTTSNTNLYPFHINLSRYACQLEGPGGLHSSVSCDGSGARHEGMLTALRRAMPCQTPNIFAQSLYILYVAKASVDHCLPFSAISIFLPFSLFLLLECALILKLQLLQVKC